MKASKIRWLYFVCLFFLAGCDGEYALFSGEKEVEFLSAEHVSPNRFEVYYKTKYGENIEEYRILSLGRMKVREETREYTIKEKPAQTMLVSNKNGFNKYKLTVKVEPEFTGGDKIEVEMTNRWSGTFEAPAE
jgi:hypothetical protein